VIGMTNAEYQREYYQRNKEALTARMKAYYQRNKEDLLGRMREYREANRDVIASWQREYQKRRKAANPGLAKAAKHRRRARVADSGGSYRPADIDRLRNVQRGRCAACAKKFCKSRPYVVDHVMPIALNGRNDADNLELLCRPCNRAKWHMHPDEWAGKLGRLFV
jgi:5-methylcytosine-specific restriction endonuclease McrA